MLRFIIRKLFSKRWMILSLLIGNILLAAIAAANTMYTRTSLERTLRLSLNQYLESNNKYPLTYTARTIAIVEQNANILKTTKKLAGSGADFGIPVLENIAHYYTQTTGTDSSLERTGRSQQLKISTIGEMENHITLIEGSGMTEEPDEDGVIDAVVSESGMQTMKLLLGEILTYDRFFMPDERPVRIRIAGVFTNSSKDDPYWVKAPSKYKNEIFINSKAFENYLMKTEDGPTVSADWYTLYDYTMLTTDNVQHMIDTVDVYTAYFSSFYGQKGQDQFTDLLKNYQNTALKIRTTLTVLQIPVYVLLGLFIFMVSRQIVDREQEEIAVLKSRGAGKGQVFGIYLLQSIVLEAIAILLGLPLAVFLTYMLGSANAFLEFVRRKEITVSFSRETVIYLAAAAVFSVLTMVIPAMRYAKTTIVNAKQRKHRASTIPLVHKFFLDVVMLGAGIYGLYSFNNQKELLTERVLAGESLDPLLFLSSSLFMIGGGLFVLRLVPLLEKLVFRIFREKWSPALYTSYLHVIRTRKQQSFIMVFLVMTIALGFFNASAARTVNRNDERNVRYMSGTDFVIQERWNNNAASLTGGSGQSSDEEFTWFEPDFNKYADLEGIVRATKVYLSTSGVVSHDGGKIQKVRIMGIHTREFGEAVNFEEGLLEPHINSYLNVLSRKASAVLVSANMKDYGYKIGDPIYFKTSDAGSVSSMRGIIYGFVEYWPGYTSFVYEKDTDGAYKEKPNYLVIANLAELQERFGLQPYQVWIRTGGNSDSVYGLTEHNFDFTKFTDTEKTLTEHKNDAVLQGTNGIFTIGFITALILCMVGFLIYWINSVRGRELQFGIFRAMGMTMREIVTMLINEHIYISGFSILLGAAVGLLTAKLYMPLIQIAYSSSENAVPLQVVTETQDVLRITVIIGIMITVCLIALGVIVRKMKIAQALKLGED